MRTGVTGLFASGKGTVCSMFEELGAAVIDTDLIARDIMQPGSEGLSLIASEFGGSFIDDKGCLDRKKFAAFIFPDNEKVKKLNELTHPLILDITMKKSSGDRIYMINTPLLFESGFNKYMDKTITVGSDENQIINRGFSRDGLSEYEIKVRLQHQIPLKEKIKLADYYIDNSGSLDNTKRQVLEIWNILKKEIRI